MDQTASYQFGVSQFTTMPWEFERDVETYARLGVQAIEICEVKLDPARLAAQMALPAAHGLEITSVQPVVRTLFPSASQPAPPNVPARMARFRQSIQELAPFAPGASFVSNTGIAPQGDIQHVWDRAISEYHALAEFASEHGVRVAIEPLNPSIMNVETALWTVEQAMALIHAVGHPGFGLCLDCWNVWQNPNLAQAIADAGASIFVVQISDWRTPRSFQDRLVPGQGQIPLADFLRAVRGAGFGGAYSVEIFSLGVPDALWDGDLEEVITQSRQGLDNAWQQSLQHDSSSAYPSVLPENIF